MHQAVVAGLFSVVSAFAVAPTALAAPAAATDTMSLAFANAEDTDISLEKSDALTREELIARYPTIAEGTERPENKKILCPFIRILERAGIFDPEREEQSALTVGIIKLASAAREFACSKIACGGVATAVSAGQLTQGVTQLGKVNVEALHKAVGVAHECGLTFAKGGVVVDDEVRARTLVALRELADKNGRLQFEDIESVKLDICAEQGVDISFAGGLEIQLIYTFLGGNERGYIEYDDVVRLFHAELPETLGAPGTVN